MTQGSRLDSQYDAFLFASVYEEDALTLSVLSILARQDVDPWQEADRLTLLSKEQAINSFATKIWKSHSERWSPSEASILSIRLIELLPSHSSSNAAPRFTEARNTRMMSWLVASALLIAISGESVQKLIKNSNDTTHHGSAIVQQESLPQAPHGFITD